MKVNVKFRECFWDNHQGDTGKILIRDILVDIPFDTNIQDVENIVIIQLAKKGFKTNFQNNSIDYCAIIKISILPTFR